MTPELLAKLRPTQVEPAKRLAGFLANRFNCIDASDTGVGKTYVACSVVAADPKATLAVVPKIATTGWRRAAEYMGESMSVIGYEKLRTGRTPFGWWDNTPPSDFTRDEIYQCETCQCLVNFDKFVPCYCHPAGIHCIKVKKKPWDYGNFNFAPEIERIIFDESHRCNGRDSLNADMMLAAARQKIPTLALSATPAHTPLQMNALGKLIGLHNGGPDFYRWARRHGCGLDEMKRWRWLVGKDKQAEIMNRINEQIFPARGVRVRTSDIPGFPKRLVVPELYDIEETGEIDRLYKEMEDSLARLSERSASDVSPDHPLTKILRARQKVELLKVPIFVELAEDYRAKGYSVVCFVNFSETLAELRRRLKCDCFIDGSPEGVKRRIFHIEQFQTNVSDRIIVNSAAGGVAVSMQDLDGNHPRVGLVSPSFSAVEFRQLLGRLHRDGGKSLALYRILLIANTIEEKVFKALTLKNNNLDALIDADLNPVGRAA